MKYIKPEYRCAGCGLPNMVYRQMDICSNCQHKADVALRKMEAQYAWREDGLINDSYEQNFQRSVSYLFKKATI